MVKFNEGWHKKNPIPLESASFEEKVRWHTEHIKECGCHGFPEKGLGSLEEKEE
ncbi:hypothetical protein HOD88_01215 [archaeon]|jgi:hypothetical protein|nr:hypothetical protein [archaeon]